MNWSTYLFNIKHKEELNDTHCWHNRTEEGSNPKYNSYNHERTYLIAKHGSLKKSQLTHSLLEILSKNAFWS